MMRSRVALSGSTAASYARLMCALLLLVFTSVAWFSAQTKSPAYDEPYHAISSWLQLRFLDFRFDNEDPPLWQYWASLPNGRSSLTANFDDPLWKSMPRELVHQWYFGVQTLYRTAGNDPVTFIRHCRGMMLSLAVLLGFLVCYWAWILRGPAAAVIAGALYCLDPNFLAHGPLMKNDVAFAMSMFGLAMALWKAGKKLDAEAIGWVLLMCVVTLCTKFSGFVAVSMVPMLLGVRALLPMPWPIFGRPVSSRFQRVLVAIGISLLAASFSYVGIWAVYGFRFAPTPQKGTSLNMEELCAKVRRNHQLANPHGSTSPDAPSTTSLPLPAKAVVFANQHGLLPQAFLAGFLFTYANALIRCDYLCGQISYVGWWWYFPFVMLVKTPIATLVAAGCATWLAFRRIKTGKFKDQPLQWASVCLAIPSILFLASAMSSNLNIGVRHILGIYPFAFVAIGSVAASVWRSRNSRGRYAIIGLALLLATESLSCFPDYIAFFNTIACNVPGGKLYLLGDSNLDWGQDLPLLAQWQHDHPKDRLYLSYFGYADPTYYGLKYTSMPGGYYFDSHRQWPDPYSRSVIAISATNLQGILLDDTLTAYYANWRKRKPIAVLGSSIYLFEYDPVRMLTGQ